MTIGKFYSKEQVQEYSDSVQHQAETAASLESWNDRPATIDDLANRIMSGLRGQAMKFHTFGMQMKNSFMSAIGQLRPQLCLHLLRNTGVPEEIPEWPPAGTVSVGSPPPDPEAVLRATYSESRQGDKEWEDRRIYWHGCPASALPGIIVNGLSPSLGTPAMTGFSEFKKAGYVYPNVVYVSESKATAARYPMPFWRGNDLLGERPTQDCRYPCRGLVAVYAPHRRRVWDNFDRRLKGNKQVAFFPFDLEVVAVQWHCLEEDRGVEDVDPDNLPLMAPSIATKLMSVRTERLIEIRVLGLMAGRTDAARQGDVDGSPWQLARFSEILRSPELIDALCERHPTYAAALRHYSEQRRGSSSSEEEAKFAKLKDRFRRAASGAKVKSEMARMAAKGSRLLTNSYMSWGDMPTPPLEEEAAEAAVVSQAACEAAAARLGVDAETLWGANPEGRAAVVQAEEAERRRLIEEEEVEKATRRSILDHLERGGIWDESDLPQAPQGGSSGSGSGGQASDTRQGGGSSSAAPSLPPARLVSTAKVHHVVGPPVMSPPPGPPPGPVPVMSPPPGPPPGPPPASRGPKVRQPEVAKEEDEEGFIPPPPPGPDPGYHNPPGPPGSEGPRPPSYPRPADADCPQFVPRRPPRVPSPKAPPVKFVPRSPPRVPSPKAPPAKPQRPFNIFASTAPLRYPAAVPPPPVRAAAQAADPAWANYQRPMIVGDAPAARQGGKAPPSAPSPTATVVPPTSPSGSSTASVMTPPPGKLSSSSIGLSDISAAKAKAKANWSQAAGKAPPEPALSHRWMRRAQAGDPSPEMTARVISEASPPSGDPDEEVLVRSPLMVSQTKRVAASPGPARTANKMPRVGAIGDPAQQQAPAAAAGATAEPVRADASSAPDTAGDGGAMAGAVAAGAMMGAVAAAGSRGDEMSEADLLRVARMAMEFLEQRDSGVESFTNATVQDVVNDGEREESALQRNLRLYLEAKAKSGKPPLVE